MPGDHTIRLDRFLWYARLAKSRSVAQQMAEAGTLRLDGRRIDRAHTPVRVGSVLAFIHGGRVRVVRIEVLPVRRGPASEAALLYIDLAGVDLAAREVAEAVDEAAPPA